MKILLCLLLLSLFISEPVWKPETSEITFSIKHALGSKAKGSFKLYEAYIQFNPEAPEKSKISATVRAESFFTDNSARDRHIKGKKYFDAEHYPFINLTLLTCKALGNDQFSGNFILKIKSTEKKVSFPFTCKKNNNKAVFAANFKLNRLDYDIGESSFMLKDTATVQILVTTKLAE
jgi:polyisoprenoid-binding protein YceI